MGYVLWWNIATPSSESSIIYLCKEYQCASRIKKIVTFLHFKNEKLKPLSHQVFDSPLSHCENGKRYVVQIFNDPHTKMHAISLKYISFCFSKINFKYFIHLAIFPLQNQRGFYKISFCCEKKDRCSNRIEKSSCIIIPFPIFLFKINK